VAQTGFDLLEAIEMTAGTRTPTIIEAAVDLGRTSTLLSALRSAGLVESLASSGALTVFAPTDDAFAALPPGSWDGVLADKVLLTSILKHHLISGRHPVVDLLGSEYVRPVEGEGLRIFVDTGGLHIGNSTIIQSDIETSNGVIHLIDSVLMP
jgi:uncharacterized surface protein with fasciclin (FAS1) repeats